MSSPPLLLRALDPTGCLRSLRVSLVHRLVSLDYRGPGSPDAPGRRPLRRFGALTLSPFSWSRPRPGPDRTSVRRPRPASLSA